jgi:hypothetical protein
MGGDWGERAREKGNLAEQRGCTDEGCDLGIDACGVDRQPATSRHLACATRLPKATRGAGVETAVEGPYRARARRP